ncbi:hypothetical protein DA075_22950 [Methylobacterium currus]|uniref:Uncharacterized protein n=1 Tax=Methylobacterium currus TaxID=2051553 RepID=A0A2R4WPF3_9HYPH|nr:hypothetical protein [Methylobacterium currus]AWB23403.1 hypothetical protein DA075_22950 [Methylobacterium currus]UHC16956.1 hypothetical protein LRS73_03280 [Methylobacterium currus]
MIRRYPTEATLARAARRHRAIRHKPAPAPAQPRPDAPAPPAPAAAEEWEPFDEHDLRALRSGWGFVE